MKTLIFLLFSLSVCLGVTASNPLIPRWYSTTSFWNVPIPRDAEVEARSAVMIGSAIGRYSSRAVLANGEKWGVPLAVSSPTSKKYVVACTEYCDVPYTEFRIPAGAKPATGSDHHLAVLDGNRELDLWGAQYDPVRDSWSAKTVVVNATDGWGAMCAEGKHCNGAVAAGFTLLGGLVRPEEFRAGHIDHALAMTVPYTRSGFIACPATHTDGRFSDEGALPEGARIQLDPSFDVEAQRWPEWLKIIARALQHYGAYVVDTGGAVAIRGVSDINGGTDKWAMANVEVQPSLASIPWDKMRVLKFRSCN